MRVLIDDSARSKLDVGAESPVGRGLVGHLAREQVRVRLAAGIERIVTIVDG